MLLYKSICAMGVLFTPSVSVCRQGKFGAVADLQHAQITNKEVYDFLSSSAAKYGIGFWRPGSGIIHQVCSAPLRWRRPPAMLV